MSQTIDIAGRVLRDEARALARAADLLDEGIERAADLILSLSGLSLIHI